MRPTKNILATQLWVATHSLGTSVLDHYGFLNLELCKHIISTEFYCNTLLILNMYLVLKIKYRQYLI